MPSSFISHHKPSGAHCERGGERSNYTLESASFFFQNIYFSHLKKSSHILQIVSSLFSDCSSINSLKYSYSNTIYSRFYSKISCRSEKSRLELKAKKALQYIHISRLIFAF